MTIAQIAARLAGMDDVPVDYEPRPRPMRVPGGSILSHFPAGFIPSALQVDVLLRTEAAFNEGKRFVLIEAPPGTGKSHIAATLASWCGGSFVCTLTLQLQKQYLKLFSGMGLRELKGRKNFPCYRCRGTCEDGWERQAGCDAEQCPYVKAKRIALAAPMTACNYASYLWNVGEQRPHLTLDEGHSVEDVLMDWVNVEVNLRKLPIRITEPCPEFNAPACFRWLERFLGTVQRTKPQLSTMDAQRDLDSLVRKAEHALRFMDREEWIAEPPESKTPGALGFVLKPLTVRAFSDRIFRWGERIVIMSATILNPDGVAFDLGIPPDQYAYVQVGSPFPKENRPIHAWGHNTTASNRASYWPEMIRLVAQAMRMHTEEKGLILTQSDEMSEYLLAGLPPDCSKRLIMAHGDTRSNYDVHCEHPGPTVLLASGYWEGADLKDDLSRFQIIPAVPRGKWSGQIKARAESKKLGFDRGSRWYRQKAFAKLLQGCGRSVRHDKDHAVTYIFDRDVKVEFDRVDSLLPDWFREAVTFH